ncbi:MAG: tRNA uridine-5-carboxymethylaminomethyl(34) synthesis GTPase MnmE [Gemmatimonadota bacterium]|nr:tRNA uridine-5-carboxymethylaminomethyl(34) synthesis GTPase MnmE [Gemmatimonadota bacterium]
MLSDPIAAVATAPGRGALALVRLSGTGAFGIAAATVRRFSADQPRYATLGTFLDRHGHPVDRGLYTVFPAPHSYTGEDLVEFCCHGGAMAASQLLAALAAAGARQAEPGEFSRRAVLNGKMDLIQAEGVADLVDAYAPAQARAALHQIDGGLSARIQSLRTQLLDLVVALAYDIDFPGEDDGPISGAQLQQQLVQARAGMHELLRTAPAGERLRTGALVVLAGAPNSGKSSLFNALLGIDRALVTPLPGTTRDAVEADTEFEGWPIRLADTAGLREADDLVERLGIAVSRRYLAAADLVLLCAEASRPLGAGERQVMAERHTLVVRTKSDLMAGVGGEEVGGISVSVVTGEGLGALREAVAAAVFGGEAEARLPELTPLLLRERHRVGLERASAALDVAEALLGPAGDAALAAHQVQGALAALDELVGVMDPDEVLGRIFSRFCVGK